jgi:hypothetical protein
MSSSFVVNPCALIDAHHTSISNNIENQSVLKGPVCFKFIGELFLHVFGLF